MGEHRMKLLLLISLLFPAAANAGSYYALGQWASSATVTVNGSSYVGDSTSTGTVTAAIIGSSTDAALSGFTPNGSSAVLASTGIFTSRIFIGQVPDTNISKHLLPVPLNIYGGQDYGAGDSIQIHGSLGLTTTYGLIDVSDSVQALRLGYYNGVTLKTVWVDGQLGVHTGTPAYDLDVAGAGRFTGQAIIQGSGTVQGPFNVATSTFAVLNGLVGVGTSSPGALLDVHGDGSTIDGANNIQLRVQGIAHQANIMLESPASITGTSLLIFGFPGAASQGFGSEMESTAAVVYANGTEYVRVSSTGLVGIGTTNPGSKLTVYNGDIRLSTSTGSNGVIFQDGSKQITAAPGSLSNAIRLQSSGYTTVGTSSWTKLEMSSLIFETGAFSVDHSSTSVAQAPLVGVYRASCWATAHTAADGFVAMVEVYKNGVAISSNGQHIMGGGTYDDTPPHAEALVQLAVGDQITCYGWQNTGGNLSMGDGAMEMFYIGQ
jgi:hypothetical protein